MACTHKKFFKKKTICRLFNPGTLIMKSFCVFIPLSLEIVLKDIVFSCVTTIIQTKLTNDTLMSFRGATHRGFRTI